MAPPAMARLDAVAPRPLRIPPPSYLSDLPVLEKLRNPKARLATYGLALVDGHPSE